MLRTLPLGLAALLASCGATTAPGKGAVRIIEAPSVATDTVQGYFGNGNLVVRLVSDSGPLANTPVYFNHSSGDPTVTVTTTFDPPSVYDNVQYTDPDGYVRARVRAGTAPGARWLVISSPSLGMDSLHFTVRPGALGGVTLEPAQALISVGGTRTFTMGSVDRFGNAVAITPALVPFGALTVQGASVTATGPGNFLVEARSGAFKASAKLDVVPVGKIVYRESGQLVTRNLDGSGRAVLMNGGSRPVWMKNGTVLAVSDQGGLVTVLPGASPIQFLAGTSLDLQNPGLPSVSPDGQWVYVVATRPPADTTHRIYRVAADGTGATVLPGIPEPVSFYSVSPDGLTVAYYTISLFAARIVTLATGAFFDFPRGEHFPWWSPQGDVIAFGADAQPPIALFTPGGAYIRSVHPEVYWEPSMLAWSADGRFILGCSAGNMRLVDLQTGSLIALPYFQETIGAAIRIP